MNCLLNIYLKMKNWYDLCKKYEALDWIDDHIVWYVWDKPKSAFKSIRYWFHCNWNKEHWNLVKAAFTSYPWDYYFMYNLIECQMNKQVKWFNEHHLVEGWDVEILRPLKWAQHCIHIINNDTMLYEYDTTTKEKVYTGPKINYNNIDRFLNYFKSEFRGKPDIKFLRDFYKKYPEEYYQLKCRYMLFKIIQQYSSRWWD